MIVCRFNSLIPKTTSDQNDANKSSTGRVASLRAQFRPRALNRGSMAMYPISELPSDLSAMPTSSDVTVVAIRYMAVQVVRDAMALRFIVSSST